MMGERVMLDSQEGAAHSGRLLPPPPDLSDGESTATVERGKWTIWISFAAVACAAAATVGVGLIKPQPASAIPSFARQTGQPCSTCHTAFPELTPYGRQFKLSGYTAGGGLPFPPAPPL